ncbi:tetratricopeptide repeat protein, partial [Desulfobacterota bacterium AH_259_B03_O07]|nr:tetratricopeptide repeat protein [Desulfobacterota bacterium AH_259_B03_O07]
ELLYQRGHPPQATYIFKHALIQDAAYQSLLKSKRRKYHKKIANTMAKKFPQIAEAHPEILAHHYAEAGQSDKAIPYWQQAGRRAVERSANVEAIGHLNKCLNMLKTLPRSNEVIKQELELQITLGVPLTATKGYGSPEVEQVYNRARELCTEVGETPQLLSALRGLLTFYLVRAKLQVALELADELMSLANKEGHLAFLVEAYLGVGIAHYTMGNPVSAQANLDKALSLYDPDKHRSQAFQAARDPAVTCLCWSSLTLWQLGYPDRASKNFQKALEMARELSHPHSIVYALIFGAWLHLFLRDPLKVIELADEEIELSNEQGFPHYFAAGNFIRGWAMVEQGSKEHEIINMQKGLDGYKSTGMEMWRPKYGVYLAESYRKIGKCDEAMLILSEAENLIKENKEYHCEADLFRVKGHLISDLSKQNQDEAENCFRKSVKIAQNQANKSLELRAVISLSRLLQNQGKKEEARAMLEEAFGWFKEGFDTADLKEAQALLHELS